MKTSRPFSTVSYNTAEFLTIKLNDYVNRHVLSFYSYIEHYPEDDQEKKHKHLYIVPNGRIDTDVLFKSLAEFDPNHPDKPLGCIPAKSSKFYDWYLYGKHDVDYLASKDQIRKYHYEQSEFVVSDSDYFAEEIHQLDMSKLHRIKTLRTAIEQGKEFADLVSQGVIPIPQVRAFEQAYNILKFNHNSERNGRVSHQSYLIDTETGECYDPK